MARLFTSYSGSFRTFNVSEATMKVVPFPGSTWNEKCGTWNKTGSRNDEVNALRTSGEINLNEPSTLHLFLTDHAKLSVDKLPSARPGHLVVPYVNTHLEYQPDKLISSMTPTELDHFFSSKKFALSAIFGEDNVKPRLITYAMSCCHGSTNYNLTSFTFSSPVDSPQNIWTGVSADEICHPSGRVIWHRHR